jgi:hypothetical protein
VDRIIDLLVRYPGAQLFVGLALAMAFVIGGKATARTGGVAAYGLLVAAAAWALWGGWNHLVLTRAPAPETGDRLDLLLLVPLVTVLTLLGVLRELSWRGRDR